MFDKSEVLQIPMTQRKKTLSYIPKYENYYTLL